MTPPVLLVTPEGVARVQDTLRSSGLDGWLLYEFHGQNPVSAALLGLSWTTRRSFVLVPARGEPVAVVHSIERSYWADWPWPLREYAGWRELEAAVAELVTGRGRLAMELSPRSGVPTLDLVPAGVVDLVREMGVEVVGSGDLVSAFHSVWSPEQAEDHRRAAEILAGLARDAFARTAAGVGAGDSPTEGALAGWIREQLAARGLPVEAGCIVAVGSNSANPHYEPGETGALLEAGRVLLIDLWGRSSQDHVFVDQTWMGFLGGHLPERVRDVWSTVRDARDAAVAFLRDRYEGGGEVRGLEVDDVVRGLIHERGYGEHFVHRTGHSIDRALHGRGPNLDHFETRDDRRLVPGVGFSVEPGIYLPGEFGVRSEINVQWTAEGPRVTPSEPQREVFLLLED